MTFVCVAPLTGNSGVTWENSHVRHKLKRVLWIPVEGERAFHWRNAKLVLLLLWTPSAEEEHQLPADWEELMDLIVLGRSSGLPPPRRSADCVQSSERQSINRGYRRAG
ncbi:MutH/Sau3AI family endonuclease [Shigella flexneri]